MTWRSWTGVTDMERTVFPLASFPGLHHSFCRLQYENRGEKLWWRPGNEAMFPLPRVYSHLLTLHTCQTLQAPSHWVEEGASR